MVGARPGSRLARAISARQLPVQSQSLCATRLASTKAAPGASGAAKTSQSSAGSPLNQIEGVSSFGTPAPDAAALKKFEGAQGTRTKDQQLPGSRYQYHPPKYNRGPLHPVQSPPSSDPIARDFVPGPFSVPRLMHTYDSTIAPDLATLTYQHTPPGTKKSDAPKARLREWDDSSPYHKNRPLRGPRGGSSSRLGLLERDLSWFEIPRIEAVTINMFTPKAVSDKEYLNAARAVLQAISGNFADTTTIKKHVVQWGLRKGANGGVKTTLRGAAALEFIDKLVTLVLPKIKDWPGLDASTGDRAGNIALGLKPDWMAYFPELETNYDMYPAKLMPGCHIFIQTTGTSDRHGRLLMQALGFPFHGKITY